MKLKKHRKIAIVMCSQSDFSTMKDCVKILKSLKISFDDLYNNYNKIVKNFSLNEKKDLFYNTALNVYKLDIKIEE